MKRRTFLQAVTGTLAASTALNRHCLPTVLADTLQDTKPALRILLRSSWPRQDCEACRA